MEVSQIKPLLFKFGEYQVKHIKGEIMLTKLK